MGFITIVFTIASLLISTSTSWAHGPKSCEPLLLPDAEGAVLTNASTGTFNGLFGPTPFRHLYSRIHHAEDITQALLNQDMPQNWKESLGNHTKWRAIESANAIKRTSVKGQPYQAYYSTWSPVGKAKRPETIILQHGFSRSSRYFHDMVILLTHLGYRVITPDGANIASTLKLTGQEGPGTQGVLTQPSPLDDANAIRDIIRKEKLDKVILLGHSRGHAVTSLVAAMPELQNKIVTHFAVNPYVEWLNDYYIDLILQNSPIYQSLIASRRMGEVLAPWLPAATKFLTDQLYEALLTHEEGLIRQSLTAMVAPNFRKFIEEALKHRLTHELVNLPPEVEANAVEQIGNGLSGDRTDLRGFDALPLYGVENPLHKQVANLKDADNGFGISQPEYGIAPISAKVRHKTVVVWGDSDTLVTPDIVALLLKADGVHSQPVAGGTHYVPTERPCDLVDIITSWTKRLTNR